MFFCIGFWRQRRSSMLKSIGSCVVYFVFASALKGGVFKYLPNSTTTAGEAEWNCFWLISTRVVRLGFRVWKLRVVHLSMCILKTRTCTRGLLAQHKPAPFFSVQPRLCKTLGDALGHSGKTGATLHATLSYARLCPEGDCGRGSCAHWGIVG